jgi:hypothetical protein
MIPKSVQRFSEKIMLQQKLSVSQSRTHLRVDVSADAP